VTCASIVRSDRVARDRRLRPSEAARLVAAEPVSGAGPMSKFVEGCSVPVHRLEIGLKWWHADQVARDIVAHLIHVVRLHVNIAI